MHRSRFIVVLLALALAAILGACGGDDLPDDPQAIIDKTFEGAKPIESGKLNLRLSIKSEGGNQAGNVDITAGGPFVNQGENKLPKFDLNLAVKGSGGGSAQIPNIEAGATSTGDKGFLSFRGSDYEIDEPTFNFLKSSVESQAGQQTGTNGSANQLSLEALGLSPKKWLTDLKREDDKEIGGAETAHVSGKVDVAALFDDLNKLRERAGGSLPQGGQLPDEKAVEEVKKSVKSATFDLFTGKDDSIIRNLKLNVALEDPAGGGADTPQSAALALEFGFADVNKDQEITAPANAKPFSELTGGLGGFGGLGGLGGGGSDGSSGSGSGPEPADPGSGSGSDSGSAGSGGSGSSDAQREQSEKYLECVQKAKGQSDLQKCAQILQN
ncbi:MAG: hypothetical protein ACR2NA_05920 [Solirubrobacterales bacterium]